MAFITRMITKIMISCNDECKNGNSSTGRKRKKMYYLWNISIKLQLFEINYTSMPYEYWNTMLLSNKCTFYYFPFSYYQIYYPPLLLITSHLRIKIMLTHFNWTFSINLLQEIGFYIISSEFFLQNISFSNPPKK